ncbi:LexA family transcriptional regulator [Sporomusa sp. KB1]|jgi:repressor LexA|uniref:LexA family protein n=1 Tax=Sporomusa sp. KB1 TaxID=943346 RepID=UPI0011A64396|nr:S24 family peptidase [Sporomusa sp. KB1]TWH47766.1 repressor LexA [Sporomusa sp. KB1]
MDKPTFAIYLAKLRNEKGLTQQQVADITGLSRARLNNYEQGVREPDLSTVATLAEFYNVSIDKLLGKSNHSAGSEKGRFLPVVGAVKITADKLLVYEQSLGEEWADSEDINNENKFYWFQIKDDCMINEGIRRDDLALVCEQLDVENGDLAFVALGDGQTTLRRVYKKDENIVLQSANPKYPPVILSDKEQNEIYIIGKVKATKRKYD